MEFSTIIDINDPVYTFCEVMDHVDLQKFIAKKERNTGRPKCDQEKLLRIVLFAFMENGIVSLRELESLCRHDIRYMWLLDEMPAPSFATFGNFIRNVLTDSVEDIFAEINRYIFAQDHVDLEHVYIDGTKIEANANRYSWVWKKSCIKSRDKVFIKLTEFLREINESIIPYRVKFEEREEYSVEYVELIRDRYAELLELDPAAFARGKGRRKSGEQRVYEKLTEYLNRLKKYSDCIQICGEKRNSFSKTDESATFMRLKRDYMGNDQLLPAYNMQIAVANEYITAVDTQQFASDMDCFVPLMEKFHRIYGHYPKYPVADAGYGSYNNYLYCEEHGMGKYMKFTMYEKTVNDPKYRDNPFRAENFSRDDNGDPMCPEGRLFHLKARLHVRGNKYGRMEEVYECEDCSDCPSRERCCKSSSGHRTIRLNRELTQIHKEVLANLQSENGFRLLTNRMVEDEGAFGVIKWDYHYKRLHRRGLEAASLEFTLISIGFNIRKYYNKKNRQQACA